VLDNMGRLMGTFIEVQYESNIDISTYPQGVYYVNIELNGYTQVEKIIRL